MEERAQLNGQSLEASDDFDKSRPSRHDYLSQHGLADTRCQGILVADDLVDLPYIDIDKVLFPGQKLALLLRTEDGHPTPQWRHRCARP